MPFPTGWPPTVASGRYSLRFYRRGTATANFEDNAFLFTSPTGNGEIAFSQGIRIVSLGGDLEFSFDGFTVHGRVPMNQQFYYDVRNEGGIAIRGGGDYEIEAW